MRVELPAYGWKPRPMQRSAWRAADGGCKRQLLIWHRRYGKDDFALARTAVAAHERIGNYWHMLPEYSQCRKALWDAVNPVTGRRRIDDHFPEALRSTTKEQEMFIRFRSGSTWQLVGSDNYNSLVGSPPVGVVFSEWALADPSAWAYLAPILAENGGWAIFITTPRGRNHAMHMLQMANQSPDWHAEVLTVEDTGHISREDIERQRKEYRAIYGLEEGDALIQQEYYCSFNSMILGSVYGRDCDELRQSGRLREFEAAAAPVHTAWDIGRTDATAVWWFQCVGNEVRVLDYEESSLKDLAYWSERILGRRIVSELADWAYGDRKIAWGADIDGLEYRRGWWYGTHFLPHDAMHKTLAASGKSVEEILRKSLGNVDVCWDSREGLTESTRGAVKACLRKAWVHPRAEVGLDTLSQYHYEYNATKRILSKQPVHNWTSHCADAARVLALSIPRASVAAIHIPTPEVILSSYQGDGAWMS